MKSLLAILIVISINLFPQGTWTPQNSGTDKTLESVYFISANIGWAVGEVGTILKTTNGGLTWNTQTINTTCELTSIYFINNNDGWVCGAGYNYLSGIVFHTTNGGTSWNIQLNYSYGFRSLFFIDSQIGWVVGASGTILKTTDGGINWFEQFPYTNSGLSSVSFIDYDNGWISANWGIILKTTNGGITWDQINFTPEGSAGWGTSNYFVDNAYGWIATAGGAYNIFKTTDGGITWEPKYAPGYFYDIFFGDRYNGWVVQWANGAILGTTNGGDTWEVQYDNASNGLCSVHFTDVNSGWAVGSGGIILKYKRLNNVNISITLKSQNTNQPLPNTSVNLAYTAPNGSTTILDETTNSNGLVNFSVPSGSDMTILIDKQGYDPYVKTYLNVTSNKSATFYLSNFSNQSSYSCPQIIKGLFDIGTSNTGICSFFDVPPSSNATIFDARTFIYENYLAANFDFYFLTVNPGANAETVPAVITRPENMNELSLGIGALLDLADLYYTYYGLGYGPFTGLSFDPINFQFIFSGPIADATFSVTQGFMDIFNGSAFSKFSPYNGYSTAGFSALDQLSTDNLGRKTGSYYENGIFIEDKFEIPNTYYSGHISHPNIILFEQNVETQSITHNLMPTALGEYTFRQTTRSENQIFGNSIADTMENYNAIPILLSFPDSLNAPRSVINLLSDSLLSGEDQIFDAQNSTDPQGLLLTFKWYLNNEEISQDPVFTLVLPDGEYTIVLIATNTINNSSIASRYFIVGNPTSIIDTKTLVPIKYSLNQNYPNPFNPTTTISYSIPTTSMVQLKIFNILGQEIATLVNEEKATGSYEVNFKAANLSSGVYLYKLQAGSFIKTKKMLLIR